MIRYDEHELNEILEAHKKWIADVGGGVRADLSNADLGDADLAGADLRDAYLAEANLSWASLRDANLAGADLGGARLRNADLAGADLSNANFKGSDLSWACIAEANLAGANLSWASLKDANLAGSDLKDASFRHAILIGTNMKYCLNVPFIPMVCPEEGSFIGYKKASGRIVKLEILSDAKRSSAFSRKCRCDKARVIEIQTLSGDKANVGYVKSDYDNTFIYTVGEVVKIDNFDDNRFNECSTGIHFFINRQEAVDY